MKRYTLQEKMKKVFCIVFITIFLITTTLMSMIAGRVYWNKSYQLCEQLVSLNLSLLNNQIQQIERIQEIIATNTEVRQAVNYYQQGIRDYSKELQHQRNMDEIFYLLAKDMKISNAYIVDKDGNYLYFYKKSIIKNYNMLNQSWYSTLIENIKMNICYVSELHDSSYLLNGTKEKCISMVMPIQEQKGYTFSPDAYLVCDINLDGMLNYGENKDNMKFALIDNKNQLYSVDSLGLDMEEEKNMLDTAKQHNKHVQIYNTGILTQSIVVTMQAKMFGWQIVGVKSLTDIRDLNLMLAVILIITILVAVTLIIILSKYVARSILMPMNHLIDKCNRVAGGDYQVIFEEGKSEEISVLSDTIKTMVINVVSLSEKVLDEEKKLSEEKLRVLQHQINPHFLNNVLQTIKALAIEKETDKVSRISTLLGRILAYSVYQPHQSVSLDVELGYLKNYVELQNIRYDNQILYSIDCDTMAEEILIPKLTLQPLVENSIEHGYESSNRLVINVSAELEKDSVCVIISDNGIGMSEYELEDLRKRMENGEVYQQDSGIGVVNVHERLKRMYGKDFGVEIVSRSHHGTTVILRIPVQKKEVEAHESVIG